MHTLIRMAFDDANNYMKNGTLMRQVINKINDIDFNAPGAVAKMRELVLQLAVTGRLVPQDKLNESAELLLERAAEEA